ncbi:Zinc finger protein 18 [Grifola frondosa]|uniref:Zinc finger protein 18 n=1 Tax=Grifola frondosa TaxID=5627 RepID=A0A1C7LRP2_GRIFR|nr:Zinc finger protein 18 [Grifola frondosa]
MERRTGFGLADQYLDGRVDLETPVSAHRFLAHSASGFLPQSGGSPSSYPTHGYHIATPTSPYPPMSSETSSLGDYQSPRLGPYALPLRRDSMDSVPDPISPSAVPPLVFDGDIGDDYDDDSESSLPSAASEASRTPYHAANLREANTQKDWSRSSFDSTYSTASVQESDASTPQHHTRSSDFSRDVDQDTAVLSSDTSQSERQKPSQKKSKMHQCNVCFKMFPRPSGLATHMNSHSGAKPYKCPIPTCTKSFAVRSNAKRHLRTHGIFPTSEHANASPSQFTVGFETPLVSEVHDVGKLPSKLRWVPQSLSTRTNVDYLREAASDSEDEYFHPSCPLLSVPLPPVTPSSPTWNPDDRYEERNSYEVMDAMPYISSQWRALPGPAIASPTSF